jgi:SNF2 family DNA or RNA helicase
MDRNTAAKMLRELMDSHGLKDWSIRMNTTMDSGYLGMCSEKDKCIILNAHHVDIHPDAEVKDTMLHEIAHALVGSKNQHGYVWARKAEELGARTTPCNHFSLPAHVIDAIRSGATVEMTFETIQIPKYKVTQLKDVCPECGKTAQEKFNIETIDKEGNIVRLITLECFHIIKKVIPRGTPFEKMVSNDWRPEVKACKHEWVDSLDSESREQAEEMGLQPNECLKCHEFKLRDFQLIGAKAAESGLSTQKGFGIFDDMGLGKTVQALAIVKYHKEYTPTLYIVKSAIKFQWFKNIIRWLGPDYMPQLISTSKDYIMPGLKSYVISYDLLRRFPREKIEKIGIKLVIIDECQQIKNPDSTRTQEVRKIVGARPDIKVIPLSGTPWKNRGEEYFPVLNMIAPTKFWSHQEYLDTWVEYYMHGNKRKQGGIKNVPRFRKYTEEILIRREYTEVMKDAPTINRMILNVQLDDLAQSTYDDEVSSFVAWYNEAVIGGEEEQISSIELLGKMARMRHITGLAKIPATLAFCEEFYEETDKKLVIFVHHIDVGQMIRNELINLCPDIQIHEITGTMSDAEKFKAAEDFNASPRAFMVASTQGGGEGIDLQTCADSILHERQWNPQNEDQATPGRFRRIGQKSKKINITVPTAEGTIDEHIGDIVETKRHNFHKGMNKSEMPVWSEADFAHQLAETIVSKYKAKNKPEGARSLTAMARM